MPEPLRPRGPPRQPALAWRRIYQAGQSRRRPGPPRNPPAQALKRPHRRDRQADSGPDRATIERNTLLANIACRGITDYWTQLVAHLNALIPVAPGRYVLDGRTVLEHLPAHGFRVVPNLRTAHTGTEYFESVLLCWRIGKDDASSS